MSQKVTHFIRKRNSPRIPAFKKNTHNKDQIIDQLRKQINAIDLQPSRQVQSFSGPIVSLGNSTDQQTSYWLEQASEDPFAEVQQDQEELDFHLPEIPGDSSFVAETPFEIEKEQSKEQSLEVNQPEINPPITDVPPTPVALSFTQPKARIISTGNAVWDEWFPEGGISSGSIINWTGPQAGGGTMHLIFDLAKKICGSDGLFVVIDPKKQIYPGSLQACGLNLRKVLFVHPQDKSEQLWALEQCLGDSTVSVVWTASDETDGRYQRRWQIAARKGNSIGFVSRSLQVAEHPAWCDAQFHVGPMQGFTSKPTFSSRFSNHPSKGNQIDSEDWTLEVQAMKCRGLYGNPKVQVILKNEILENSSRRSDQKALDINNRTFGN